MKCEETGKGSKLVNLKGNIRDAGEKIDQNHISLTVSLPGFYLALQPLGCVLYQAIQLLFYKQFAFK